MFKNTIAFSETSQTFLQNGEHYILADRRTPRYISFWNEEKSRCINGYTVNGVRITGKHYYYLNFSKIKRIKDDVIVGIQKKGGILNKSLGFPKFLDMDYSYFHDLEEAELTSKGLIVAKARRKGFSYKNGAVATHKYYFQKDSCTIIGASDWKHINTTFGYVREIVNHIDEHTEFGKLKLIDNSTHIKSGYRKKLPDGSFVEKGYKSEIIGICFKDNPDAARGKSADLFLFEEAGDWKGLKICYNMCSPVFKDGENIVGMPIIFGTGGDMESGTVDFCEMFYNPALYNLKEYKNKWDEGFEDTTCGLFIPDYLYKPPHVDEDGNSLIEPAIASGTIKREFFLKKGNRSSLDHFVSQEPYTPKEAFTKVVGNIFPAAELNKHLAFLLTNSKVKNYGMRGKLIRDKNGIIFEENQNLFEAPFPYNILDSEGCLVIYEMPEDDAPFGLYIAGLDPYNQDKAGTSNSLGSLFVYKRNRGKYGTIGDVIVAEYTGRPDTSIKFYENITLILEFFKCKMLHESEIAAVSTYFKQINKTYLLCEQPRLLNVLIPETKIARSFGMPMTGGVKRWGEQYIRDWLLEERGQELNLNTILSVNLVRELISYNIDGNFDRVMAFMMVMFYNQDLFKIKINNNAVKKVGMFDSLDKALGIKNKIAV